MAVLGGFSSIVTSGLVHAQKVPYCQSIPLARYSNDEEGPAHEQPH
jgi:hypothetical protein